MNTGGQNFSSMAVQSEIYLPHEVTSFCQFFFQIVLYTLFFYKDIFYKNIEAEICEILRIS